MKHVLKCSNREMLKCSRTKREDLSLSMALLPTPWSVSVKARLPSDRGRYLCSDYGSNDGGDGGDDGDGDVNY